jgi:DNA-binding SARP family transcriptional activator
MTGFHILGPVEVLNGQRRLDLGGPRQLTLLALFLLHANRALSTDTLIDAVWGERRVAGDNRLGMAIARLRKTLAPLPPREESVLRTVAGGYLLRVAAGTLDADVFRGLISEGQRALETGDAKRANEKLREALALWRGPPLAEVTFEDFAQAEIRRLEELRVTALEARIEADLQLGRHTDVVGELEGLLVEQPSREHFAAQLMLALYRSGRQTEALDIYQRIRVRLAHELGLEPGPAIRALQAQILEHAVPPGPADHPVEVSAPQPGAQPLTAPLPARLRPHGPAAFVDRHEERDAVMGALADSAASGRRVAFVMGEAGIGKTRLVSEVATEAHAAGALVLAGRCDNTLELPYQPFADALEHLVQNAPRELLTRHVEEFGASVMRLVPPLAARIGTPADVRSVSESERYVLFRAIEGLLAAACVSGPLLLVLEDLHWADIPSLKLLRRLLTSPQSLPLMVLATCRFRELDDAHPLRDLLADLHHENDVLRIELSGLNDADVLELVRSMAGRRIGDDASRIAGALTRSTNGNPFFITELVRSFDEDEVSRRAATAGVSGGDDGGGRVPVSIAETLGRRIARMDEGVIRCLRVAALVGDEFELDLISEVAGVERAEDAITAAEKAGIIVEVPAEPLRFRFAHALMQRYLDQELGSAQRTTLHRQVALALQKRPAGDDAPAAELARHWIGAGPAALEQAIRTSVLAGDEALGKLGADEARRWYETALALMSRGQAHDSDRCDVLIRRAQAERQAGDRRFRETLLEAAAIAQTIGDNDLLVRAALANTRGMQSETGIVDASRLEILDAALRAVDEADSAARARLLAMRAAELMYAGDRLQRARLSDEALAMARRIDDPGALSEVLNMRFVTLLAPETLAARAADAVEAVTVADSLHEPLKQFFAYHWRSYSSIESGDIAEARTWAARELEIAESFRQPTMLWLSTADQANLAIVAGDLSRAQRLAKAALEIGRDSEPDAGACYAAQRASIAFEAGRVSSLVGQLEQAVQANPGLPGLGATLALALMAAERTHEARQLVRASAAAGFADLPRDVTWLAVLCIYAHVCAELDDAAAAERLYELLSPWHGQIAFPAFGVWGPVDLYLGELARATGRFEPAEQHLLAASQVAGRAGASLWQQRASRQLALVTAGSR